MLVFSIFISFAIGQEPSKKGELTVIIQGMDNDKGVVKIALNNSQEDYEANDQAYRGEELKIIDNEARWTFEKIPFGKYAIKVYHDEDNDDELGTNFLGIPDEEYGFSNDARGTFGPASWEDAKFLFNSAKDTVIINVE
jgi:uncharacterized protein (DUF2141 family)